MQVFKRFKERYFSLLTSHYHLKPHEGVLLYQIIGLQTINIFASFMIFVMTIKRYLQENYLNAGLDFFMTIVLVYATVTLYKNHNKFKYIARLIIGLAIIILTLLLTIVVDIAALLPWYSLTIFMMFFYLGSSEAWKILTGIITALISLFVFDLYKSNIEIHHLFLAVGNLFLMSSVLHWYEKIKIHSEHQHEEYQRTLKIEILNKTEELSNSNFQLEELNATLEERVIKEMKKTRDKEQQMLQQSRMAQMGEMLAMIAHQWRQPLASITATANNLKVKILLNQYDQHFFDSRIDNINTYAQHLSTTIDDFRDFFKVAKIKSKTTLQESVQNTLLIIQSSLTSSNIELKTDFFEDNSYDETNTLEIYTNELKQVLLNLIKNAQDALIEKSIKNPFIFISTTKKNNKFKITIEDNAGGINSEFLEKIFEPYFTTKETRDGTGLGLYISKTIVNKHLEGELEVQNRANGVAFIITLNP